MSSSAEHTIAGDVSGLPSLARAARVLPPDCTVHLHAGPAPAWRVLLAVVLLRRRHRLIYDTTLRHCEREAAADSAHGRAAAMRARFAAWAESLALRSADAVLAATPQAVAEAGSAGAEAWRSPLVPLPAASPHEPGAVLWVGALESEQAATVHAAAGAWPAERTLRCWGPPEQSVGGAGLPAAVAAAALVVVPRGHAHAALVADYAGQLGTRLLELEPDAGAEQAAAAIDAALAAAAPTPHDPNAAALLDPVYAPDADEDDDAAALRSDANASSNHNASANHNGNPNGSAEVAVVAWTSSTGRTSELAQAVGGQGRTFYDLNLSDRRLIPLRYALSGVRTAAFLARRRPRTVIVANPPIIPPVIGFLYARLTGARLVLDSQTNSFGEKQSRIGKLMLPLHEAISRRADCTLVGAEEFAERVRGWGGEAAVFHEAPPVWRFPEPADPPTSAPVESPPARPLRALWVGVFAPDEPLDALLAAAAQLPEIEFRITGDLRRAPADHDAAPPNVTWLGFVRGHAYPHELAAADVVITMTTAPASALRGAAEAVFAHRPLITSDWPFLRELFPHALHAANDADGIVAAVRAFVADPAAARQRAAAAHALQLQRWRPQRDVLIHATSARPTTGTPA